MVMMMRLWSLAASLSAAAAAAVSTLNDTAIPQIGFIVESHAPLQHVVHMLNQAVYSHLLWNQAVEDVYFMQEPHEVRVMAEPKIYNMRARAYPVTEFKDLTFVASERCENTRPESFDCRLSPLTKKLELETLIFNGKGVQVDRNRTMPVDFVVGSSGERFQFGWDHTVPTSRPRLDTYTFDVAGRSVLVPPRTSYIIEYEMRRTVVEGHLLLDTVVGTDISETFFWAMETCAMMKGEQTCVPVRYGDFYTKQVRHELTKGARAHLCGTHDPRFCAVSLGEDDKLHLMSKAQFRAGVDASFKIRIWEENHDGRTDRLLSVIDVKPQITSK